MTEGSSHFRMLGLRHTPTVLLRAICCTYAYRTSCMRLTSGERVSYSLSIFSWYDMVTSYLHVLRLLTGRMRLLLKNGLLL